MSRAICRKYPTRPGVENQPTTKQARSTNVRQKCTIPTSIQACRLRGVLLSCANKQHNRHKRKSSSRIFERAVLTRRKLRPGPAHDHLALSSRHVRQNHLGHRGHLSRHIRQNRGLSVQRAPTEHSPARRSPRHARITQDILDRVHHGVQQSRRAQHGLLTARGSPAPRNHPSRHLSRASRL